ncbi:MAG: glycoside hydrolase family 5 protein [Oscillospiraceae bacterium]|nr:glycoside hydrolase family 5 protein [Oscillospiraceae bacterium]
MENIKWAILKVLDVLAALLFILYSMVAAWFGQFGEITPVIPDTPAFAFAAELGVGWNMGNALEATIPGFAGAETETLWGSPKITKAVVDKVKAAGFSTVRIPITWAPHLGPAPDYTIDAAWLDRVQEVVDFSYGNGLYTIINMHHDDMTWFIPDPQHEDATTAEFTKLWEQIAARFEPYGDHLIFEAANEPRVVGSLLEWAGGTPSQHKVVNRLNRAFVDVVRRSGGNNAERWLLLPTYAASCESTALRAMEAPTDPHALVSIHAYYPRKFTSDKYMDHSTWSERDSKALQKKLREIYRLFIAKGVPVYMGEFGAVAKDNDAERAAYITEFRGTLRSYGISCGIWDNGYAADEGALPEAFALLDRRTLKWRHPALIATLTDNEELTINRDINGE